MRQAEHSSSGALPASYGSRHICTPTPPFLVGVRHFRGNTLFERQVRPCVRPSGCRTEEFIFFLPSLFVHLHSLRASMISSRALVC